MIAAVIEMNNGENSFPDIRIGRGWDPAFNDVTFPLHTHTNAELFCLVAGKAVYHVEGSEYPLLPGDILLMRPMEAHFVEVDNAYDYDRMVLVFDPDILRFVDPENALMRPLFDRKAGKRNHYTAANFDSDRYFQYLLNMLSEDADRPTVIANLILLLKEIGAVFDQTDHQSTQADTLEYKIIRYINKNLDKELNLSELSKRFFISRAQLCMRFKNATGTSVGKYISTKRLILAQQKILQGQKPTDIFQECGYHDYSTFYRAYTQLFRHSPKQENGVVPTTLETDWIDLI